MGDCLKELDETDYWLDLLVESALVSKSKMEELIDETHQLTAILITIINKAKKNDEQ